MRRAEDRLIDYVLNCAVYKSGSVFAVHEMQRSIQHRDGLYKAGRVREILNTLAERGKIEKVPAPNGETHYKQATSARAILSRLWANPVADHSPRWC